MQITFITSRMVFGLAWTIGDASSLSCQSLYQLLFFHTICSSNINRHRWTLLSDVVPLKKLPQSLPVVTLPLVFVPLKSSGSFLLCTELFFKLSRIWDYVSIFKGFCYIRNGYIPACNKLLIGQLIYKAIELVDFKLHLSTSVFHFQIISFMVYQSQLITCKC
jgi:hypothetical protein